MIKRSHLVAVICTVIFIVQFCASDAAVNSEVCSSYDLSEEQCKHLESRMFETELLKTLHSVIENGFPGLGIPPLDPLNIEGNIHFDQVNIFDLFELDFLNIENVHSTKLSEFTADTLSIQLVPLGVVFNLTFPEINLDLDHYDFTGILVNSLPAVGDGAVKVTLHDLAIAGEIFIGARTETSSIYLKNITLDVALGSSELLITGLMGGSRVTYMASEIASVAAPNFLKQFQPILGPPLIEGVLNAVNSVLDELKLTVVDLLSCLREDPNCPLNMKEK